MRKKILSVLLLGLFTVASTSTLVSCKDYDDDIANLQNQITTNAQNLQKLVEEKAANLQKEIDALETTVKSIDEAYKAADKVLQQNIDAANAAAANAQATADQAVKDAAANKAAIAAQKAECEAAKKELQDAIDLANTAIKNLGEKEAEDVKALLEADKVLTAATEKAQARADEAYALAKAVEANAATKAELAEAAKKAADDLAAAEKKAADNLAEVKKTLEGQIKVVSDNLDAANKKIAANETAISKANAAIASLRADMEKGDLKLNGKIDSLDNAVKEAAKAAAAQQALVDKKQNQVIDSIAAAGVKKDTKIATLESKYNALDAHVAVLADSIQYLNDSINAGFAKVDAALAVLEGNLNALITSIIYNAQTNPLVVTGDPIAKDTIFPYKDAGATLELKKDQQLIQEEGGIIYATINPAEVKFEDKVNVAIKNSQNEAHALFSLGEAKAVTASDPVLTTTRATDQNLGNGLYKFQVKTANNGIVAKTALTGKNSVYSGQQGANNCIAYALQTTYKQSGAERTVTSHYDLAIVPKKTTAPTSINIIPVEPGQDIEATEPAKKYQILFDVEVGSELTGDIKLEDMTDANVFATYLELDTAWVKKYPAKAAQVTISETGIVRGSKIGSAVNIKAAQALVNDTIPVKWYALTYDGEILVKREKVVFSQSKFGTLDLTLESKIDKAGTMEVDFMDELKKALETKQAGAFAEFLSVAQDADSVMPKGGSINPLDSIRVKYNRGTVGAKDSVCVFFYNPAKCNESVNNAQQKITVQITDANSLRLATINFTVNIKDPDYLNNLQMRIASAFNVIDQDKDYSKDYTVAWATNKGTNADTTKVGYLWDTHSFNIERFTDATKAKNDDVTTLSYKAAAAHAAYNHLQGINDEASDSVMVENIRVYSGNGITAVNTHDAAGTAVTLFDLQQIINYYGIIPHVHDNFKFSVVSPINYGIYRGGAKKVEATANNVGDATAELTDFVWVDYSDNLNKFTLADNKWKRIASVECELLKDAANNYALVKEKKITYNKTDNKLYFAINYGAATDNCELSINIIVIDMWGIKTVLPATIKVKKSEAGAKRK